MEFWNKSKESITINNLENKSKSNASNGKIIKNNDISPELKEFIRDNKEYVDNTIKNAFGNTFSIPVEDKSNKPKLSNNKNIELDELKSRFKNEYDRSIELKDCHLKECTLDPHLLQRYIKIGYLELVDKDTFLDSLTTPFLKGILRDNGLPLSGSKNELYDRIIDNNAHFTINRYQLTDKGNRYIKLNYPYVEYYYSINNKKCDEYEYFKMWDTMIKEDDAPYYFDEIYTRILKGNKKISKSKDDLTGVKFSLLSHVNYLMELDFEDNEYYDELEDDIVTCLELCVLELSNAIHDRSRLRVKIYLAEDAYYFLRMFEEYIDYGLVEQIFNSLNVKNSPYTSAEITELIKLGIDDFEKLQALIDINNEGAY